MARGRLRIYLGAAPGVGKTYAMLGEGHRRIERGTDAVIGFIEDHGRPLTRALADGLETIPRIEMEYRGATFSEMDVDAVLRRRPHVALVDELAHTNIPGSRNTKRWEDIEELLAAGIDVISTVNIQHLESLNDVVEKITGVPQRETVPDSVVRAADQVELVDMSAEALRRRMAHGNIYAPEKVDAALANYFRVGNLTALRELALLWLADKVDEGLQHYRADHHIDQTWETRERVVVALTGGEEGETLLRRGARIAARTSGGDLLAVHVARSDGLTGASPGSLATQRRLVESLGGTFHQVVSDNVPDALLEFARVENATQLVLGASRRSGMAALLPGSRVGSTVIKHSGDIDVHMITHSAAGRGSGLPRSHLRGGLTRRRQLQGFALAAVLLPSLCMVLSQNRSRLNLISDVLVFQLVIVAVALVGGGWPAVASAVVGSVLLNYYFVPPLHTFNINERNNALALVVFLLVAMMVSAVVATAARRTREAARSSAESALLSAMAGSVLRGESALPALMERVRESFAMTSVELLERGDLGGWETVARVGPKQPVGPDATAETEVPAGDRFMLRLLGRALPIEDRRVLSAFAAQAAVALEQGRLAEAAAAVRPLAEADRLRTALLAAVGHDLRSPLASAKAAITSLRSSDVEWTAHDEAELLATADESLDQLARLVKNILDVSRMQAGVLAVTTQLVGLDDIVPLALADLGPEAEVVVTDVPESLPPVVVDPALLERVLANLVANALRYAPVGAPPVITASSLGSRVELRVIDRGPGIPLDHREQVFAPFQRLGDTDNTTGLGLGLALSRGLTEAMQGSLVMEETPGGGLTMVVSLPAADPSTTPPVAPPGQRERKLGRSSGPVR